MKQKERFDLMDLTKRALLVDRYDVIKHIIKGVAKQFNLNIIFAYLNPNFMNQTDYFIIAKMNNAEELVVFHAISFGECSTTQFDMYASKNALPEFYSNMMNNATRYPISIFESGLVEYDLSPNPSAPNYWLKTDDKNIADKMISMLEKVSPSMSNKKRRLAERNMG